ncbi:MAG: ribonuclease III [Elainellaceae cyanobacterium]
MTAIPELRQRSLQTLTAKLGLTDTNAIQWPLLDQALTHVTADPKRNYERLEFVGDAVVRLSTASFLFAAYPDLPEGELSAIRAVLMSDRVLTQIAQRYGLLRYVLMNASAAADTAAQDTIAAAAFEALLGSLYLSTADLSLIQPWFDPHLKEFAEAVNQDPAHRNYKGALQGLTQGRYQTLPDYRVEEVMLVHGHPERFVAQVWLQDKVWGEGKGPSKKLAEQAAAQEALVALQAALQALQAAPQPEN